MDLFGKQHAANLKARTWSMEEFENYFVGEGEKKGNSVQFQAVAEALGKLKEMEETSGQVWAEASDKLMRACRTYSDSHKTARSPGGRERLAVVESLLEYQAEKGRQRAETLKNRQWNMEELGNYIRDHERLAAGSPEFREVSQAFRELASRQSELITRESAMEMIKASDRLKKACQAFSDSRKGSYLVSDQEYLAFMDGLSGFHESLNLDQARDMKVVRSHEGKTWGQVGSFEVAETVLDSVNVMGAAVSQRLRVRYKGKSGFFTEQFYLKSLKEYVKDQIEKTDRTKDPKLREALEQESPRLVDRLNRMYQDETLADSAECRVLCSMGEYWDQMEEGPKKKTLGKKLIGDVDALNRASVVMAAYQKRVTDRMGEEEKARLMDQMIQETLKKDEKKLKETLSQNKDFLMGVPRPIAGMSESQNRERYFKLALIQAKAKDPKAGSLERLIHDENGIRGFANTVKAADAALSASAVGVMKLDAGMELTTRNIASSRVAELLGIGGIIAHSEKMIVRNGDKVMTGCFMEYASGTDLENGNERSNRIAEQVEVKGNAGLYKDSMTMETFDYLCGQNDRHDVNLFYKISEPDENGKRNIVGFQGIDSDLAFGDSPEHKGRGQGDYTNQVFIDRELAQNIRRLDRETLEYAIGDLIPAHQIDAMMERVERFKKHMDHMIEIDPDKWDLKAYGPQKDGEKELTGKDKLYAEGLQALEAAFEYRGFMLEHKIGQASRMARDLKERRAKAPKVAIDFKELQSRESRDALKRNPKFNLAERQKNDPKRQRQANQAAGPHK